MEIFLLSNLWHNLPLFCQGPYKPFPMIISVINKTFFCSYQSYNNVYKNIIKHLVCKPCFFSLVTFPVFLFTWHATDEVDNYRSISLLLCDRKVRDLEYIIVPEGFHCSLKLDGEVLSNQRAYFASEREPLKLKTAKRFLQMLCFVFLIFLSKMNGQMQSKLDKQNIFNFNAHVAESWLY